MKLKQLYFVLAISLVLLGVLLGTKKKSVVHEGNLKPGDKIFEQWDELSDILRENSPSYVTKVTYFANMLIC